MPIRRLLYSLTLVFVCAIVVVVGGIWYTGYETSQNDKRWCQLLNPLVEAYKSTPPTATIAVKVAGAINNLHDEFGC